MSQSCTPFEVMQFLHDLFSEFDRLVDADSRLWKVETIGDAFMLAAGLATGSPERPSTNTGELGSSEEEGGPVLTNASGRSMASVLPVDSASCARAALTFGKGVLAEAARHVMPNGKQCQIRAGMHTGDVVSGVAGLKVSHSLTALSLSLSLPLSAFLSPTFFI